MEKEKIMTPEEFTGKALYLPKEFRDFHDQKDLFKTIQELYAGTESMKINCPNWVHNHIYTIDFFLWFMGQHGYTLQKSRSKKVKFYNLTKTLNEFREKRIKAFATIINSR